MSLRRSQSTPEARSIGPDWPSASASSAESRPIPFVRSSQILFRSRIASYSSTPAACAARRARLRRRSPPGCPRRARPPGSSGCASATPVTISKRSSTMSRSRNAYQNIEIAPSSSAEVPSQTRCEWIRFSSDEAHPHPRRLLGRLEAEQLLDREHEDELVRLEGEVVDPLGVRDALPVRLLLHRLLEAGVEVADHGLDARRRARRRGRRSAGARRASTGGSARS